MRTTVRTPDARFEAETGFHLWIGPDAAVMVTPEAMPRLTMTLDMAAEYTLTKRSPSEFGIVVVPHAEGTFTHIVHRGTTDPIGWECHSLWLVARETLGWHEVEDVERITRKTRTRKVAALLDESAPAKSTTPARTLVSA